MRQIETRTLIISLVKFMHRYFWFMLFYITWITAHYVASHLYVKYCTPATLMGFMLSPFIVPAPHCEGLRWIISTGGSNITAMWAFTGVWVAREISNVIMK